MKMKNLLGVAAGGFMFMAASTSMAAVIVGATIVQDPSGGDLTYTIHNSGNVAPTQIIDFDNIQGPANDFVVRYQVPVTQAITEASNNSGGFAWVGGTFNELTITPLSGFDGFTAFKFNFEFDSSDAKKPYEIQFDLVFQGGDTQHFDLGKVFDNDTEWGNPAKFLITALDDNVITSINFSMFGAKDLPPPQPFHAIKQASFEAVTSVVPEPATWAMMLVGFFGVGALARRKQSLTLTA
ncbi:MAG TPA: PEPxxWA-CTERM sorting domain-containing protein [Phenylobacterium sp.]|nr:PEPxxWA-CTERM sorting domain-containing protein [Phenylobacterium sp.]